MSQLEITRGPQDAGAALLFTNNLGEVIFVDHPFLKLLDYPEAEAVAGEPLYRALGLDQSTTRQLFDHLLETGQIRDHRLVISGTNGITRRVLLTGVAAHDTRGNFIGADIKLREVDADVETEIQQDAGEETLVAPVRDVLDEATPTENDMFLQLYFTTHVKALYVLLSRLVGLWVHNKLDNTINETAQRQGWAARVKNGLLTPDAAAHDASVYRVLLGKAVDYAVHMIGQPLVAKEMELADAQMHEGVLVLATQAGLRELFKRRPG